MNRQATWTLVIAATLLLGGQGWAAPSPADALAPLLMGYEWSPNRKALEAATQDPAPALMTLHGDAARSRLVRLRALDALGYFPRLDVRGYLHRLVTDEKAREIERHHAATALLHGFGEGALASTRPVLVNSRCPASLRITVADAMLRYGGGAGRRAVQEAAAAAKSPVVAAALADLLMLPETGRSVLR